MTSNDTWHAAPDLLARYAAGELAHVSTASVEAHLLACGPCRGELARLAPADRLARNLEAVYARIDEREPTAERIVRRLGASERVGKILVVTPSARLAWLAAVAIAIAVAILVGDLDNGDERVAFGFLVAAPLVPLGVVASTFAGRSDPAREVVAATPVRVLELLLIRALAVVGPAMVVLVATAIVLPGPAAGGALWLLPSLALAATTLVLATRIAARAAASIVGAAWVAGALISVRGAPRADLIERCAAFQPSGQLVFVALSVVASLIVASRRDAFEHLEQRSAL